LWRKGRIKNPPYVAESLILVYFTPMAIGPRLEFRQSQTLVMTPQLRQAIKLLQFSNLEVAAFVEEELERNPLLEREEAPDYPNEAAAPEPVEVPPSEQTDTADLVGAGTLPEEGGGPLDHEFDGYEAFGPADGMVLGGGTGARGFETDDRDLADLVANRPSLREHLGEQMRLGFADKESRLIGAYLIALLDPAGRLSAEPAAIAAALGVELARVEAVRQRMMGFDPVGMFARSLAECLAAQLREKNRLDPAMQAMLANLELLARRDLKRLMTVCGVDWEDLQDMMAEIRALDPKPGAAWESQALPAVIPDVLMRAAPGGDWVLELNPETLPRVLVNESFYARVSHKAERETKSFLTEKLATANWLVKSLHQRAQTILKVSAEIVQRQDGFFRHGVSHLRPLILRDIADTVSLHESTVSRVTANKYIATPRGTFELKYFFTTAIAGSGGESHSAEAVRHRIRALVGAESAADILSDDAIVVVLRKEGVDIARRTVAKYREALRIPSSVQRKREKAVPA
jgi:RNA polymerase sigma-54 factor